MNTVSMSLKKWAICALGVVALAGMNVDAAAVHSSAPRCGYGYKGCPDGYQCVESPVCKNTSLFFEITSSVWTTVLTYCIDASFCQKADYASDLNHESKRQAAPGPTFTPVIGVPDRVVERKPIAVLQNSFPDVFNMFVLALQSIQARNEATDISYYQVSGQRCNNSNFLTTTMAHSRFRNPWLPVYSVAVPDFSNRQSRLGLLHPF